MMCWMAMVNLSSGVKSWLEVLNMPAKQIGILGEGLNGGWRGSRF